MTSSPFQFLRLNAVGLGASEFALRLLGGLHACRDKLTLVANAVVRVLVRVVSTASAHAATPVGIARNDSLHVISLSVESNAAVSGGNA